MSRFCARTLGTLSALLIATPLMAVPDSVDSRLNQICGFQIVDVSGSVASGTGYWRLKTAVFEDESQAGGTHHIFMKALDVNGNPIENQKIFRTWGYNQFSVNESVCVSTGGSTNWDCALTKGGGIDNYFGNFPMWASCPQGACNGPFNAFISQTSSPAGLIGQSDKVIGMWMHNPNGTGCGAHVSFRLTWQWTISGGGGPPPQVPTITLSPTSLTPSVIQGSSPANQTFTVKNTGAGTLNYSISDNVSWLSVNPASGTSTGETDNITVSYTTSSLSAGTYNATITVSDSASSNNPQTIGVTLTVSGSGGNLITNGDFSNGTTGWTKWTQRGNFTPTVTNGKLDVQSSDVNGGMWQQFNTGGSGQTIDISGFWASNPTVANASWSEVLIINAGWTPTNGSDVNSGQSNVIMIYKNDTFTTTGGWSGDMDQTAAVTNVGSFTSAGSTATILLKTGNSGGTTTGTLFDDIVVGDPGPPTPSISLTKSTLSPSTKVGTNAPSDSFGVSNGSQGTLNYSISDNVSWLSVSPASGDSTGETDTITVTYATSGLSIGTHNATITVSDPNASNNSQTIAVTLTVRALPTITLNKSSISVSTDEGSSPASNSFTVTDTGGTNSLLNYSITDNVSWLSVTPDAGTSTGESDTITVNFSTASLADGSYNATITVSDPCATNNPQTISVSLTVNEVQITTVEEDFNSMPSWSSEHNATWGSAATWAVSSGGQSGNHLNASRSTGGSSVKVKTYTIDASTAYTISVYMKSAGSGNTYWAETAYRLGSHSAADFDNNAGAWTMIKKFDNGGTNGNSDTWTQYSKTFNSGGSTQISVGYKLGSTGTAPVVRWDTLRVE